MTAGVNTPTEFAPVALLQPLPPYFAVLRAAVQFGLTSGFAQNAREHYYCLLVDA